MVQFLFITVCFLWGSSFILMGEAAKSFGPMSIGAGRLITGATLLVIFLVAQRRPWGLGRRHIPALLFVAFICYAWPFAEQPRFIRKNNASALMGMIIALVPLLTIVVSIPLLNIRPTRRELLGVLMGLGFFALLMFEAQHVLNIPPLDLALATSVPVCYAIANTYIKRRFSDVPAMAFACAALGVGGLMLLPLSLGFEHVDTTHTITRAAIALAILGIFATGVAYAMFYRMIQTHGPLYAGMVSYALPVVAMFWGWLNGERLTVTQIVAVVGVLASIVVVQFRAPRSHQPPVALPPD